MYHHCTCFHSRKGTTFFDNGNTKRRFITIETPIEKNFPPFRSDKTAFYFLSLHIAVNQSVDLHESKEPAHLCQA